MRTLGDDAGLIGAAYAAGGADAAHGDCRPSSAKRHLALATKPSTRFILYWETDANDVDFHIQGSHGGHAFFAAPKLAKRRRAVRRHHDRLRPGVLRDSRHAEDPPVPVVDFLNYYSQGPMGYGMGLLEVETFDGKGKLGFDDWPYVIMNDHAYVDLGKF